MLVSSLEDDKFERDATEIGSLLERNQTLT